MTGEKCPKMEPAYSLEMRLCLQEEGKEREFIFVHGLWLMRHKKRGDVILHHYKTVYTSDKKSDFLSRMLQYHHLKA